MTLAQAGELLALLSGGYPWITLKDETTDLWLEELGKLDYRVGEKAVRSLLASSKGWPAIAHLNEQVTVALEQAARVRREQERREAELAEDLLPRIPLREIPAVVEFQRRSRIEVGLPLEQVDEDVCDDCGRRGQRCRVGHFLVCETCARHRLSAVGRLTSEEVPAA